MRYRFYISLLAIILTFLPSTQVVAKEYIIYNIAQDFPMGIENEVLKKNFYVNFGSKQGLREGTILDVYRTISRNDPYKSKQTYEHHVKIGELKVLHAEDENSITMLESNIAKDLNSPLFEIGKFMIGDKVTVKIKN